MPRVAKQRIDYLFEALKSYRDDPRPGADTAMSQPVGGRATTTSWRSRITPRRCSARRGAVCRSGSILHLAKATGQQDRP